jgi:choline dehydrogenase-like flavoprotein
MSAPLRKPDPVDVCIVGAGASGAVVAKALTEAGLSVVALERGLWRKPEDFGIDELANLNRHYIGPDFGLHPRTVRHSADEEPELRPFSPLPQVVGGGTTHWAGWLLRLMESDFKQRSLHGDIDGASLVDWPIDYADLEPYYEKVEWRLGTSGQAGANRFEAPRRAGYPCPPMPQTRYAQLFHEACAKLGYNSFQTPIAMLSQQFRDMPPTIVGAMNHLYGDPTGTRPSVITTFIPDALATGRFELRPECLVRELTVDASKRVKTAIYEDADGNVFEQEAKIFIVAAGAIESARFLLLQKSPYFPNGLANDNDLVGRFMTVHEWTAATGVFEKDTPPIHGWAGGGYLSASSYEFYDTDESRGFIGGGHVVATGGMVAPPLNYVLPKRPAWGQAAKDADREFFNHTMSVGLIVHDLPQATNRVELDENVRDAWGVPVAKITCHAHPNDLAQARWITERNAEILEAAGATKVWQMVVDELTGSCLHQHGTVRMGHDPEASVVNAEGRAHDVENLYVCDGSTFPTASGANPTLTIMANAWRIADHIIDRGMPGRTGREQHVATGD